MAVINISDIYPEKFFNPLASKHRAVYLGIAEIIDEKAGGRRNLLKTDADEYAASYLLRKDISSTDGFEEDGIDAAKTAHAVAQAIIRKLEEYGWFYEKRDEGTFNRVLAVTPELSDLLDYFRSVSTNERGYIDNLYSTREKSENKDRWENAPYKSALKPILAESQKYIRGLRRLDKECNARMETALRKDAEGKRVEDILMNYQEYIDGSLIPEFYELMRLGSPTEYAKITKRKLQLLQEDKEIVARAAEEVQKERKTGKDEAEMLVEEMFEDIYEYLVNEASIHINSIKDKIGKYVNRVATSIRYVKQSKDRTLALAKEAASVIAEDERGQLECLTAEEMAIFSFHRNEYVDINTLRPKTRTSSKEEKPAGEAHIKEDVEKLYEDAMSQREEQKYTKEKSLDALKKLMKGSRSVRAKDIGRIRTKEEMVNLLSIFPYAEEENYEIRLREGELETKSYILKDFEIREGKEK